MLCSACSIIASRQILTHFVDMKHNNQARLIIGVLRQPFHSSPSYHHRLSQKKHKQSGIFRFETPNKLYDASVPSSKTITNVQSHQQFVYKLKSSHKLGANQNELQIKRYDGVGLSFGANCEPLSTTALQSRRSHDDKSRRPKISQSSAARSIPKNVGNSRSSMNATVVIPPQNHVQRQSDMAERMFRSSGLASQPRRISRTSASRPPDRHSESELVGNSKKCVSSLDHPREMWQIQKRALQEKFGSSGWSPRKRLSPDDLEGVRILHSQYPDKYTTPALAEYFQVSPEAIRRILKSKWRPNEEEQEDRRNRWNKRGENIWSQMVEIGIKPPKKWREMGVGNKKERQGAMNARTSAPVRECAHESVSIRRAARHVQMGSKLGCSLDSAAPSKSP